MPDTLDQLRAELDATGDPQLCLVIADFVEEQGGDPRGWRWLGEHGRHPSDPDPGDDDAEWLWWNEADGRPRRFRLPGDGTLRRIPEAAGFFADTTRLASYDDAQQVVRNAIDTGLLDPTK